MKMRAFRPLLLAATIAAVGVLGYQATAQGGPAKPDAPKQVTPEYGGMTFNTNVGSFKLLGGGEIPAQGKLEFEFNGTVLVSGLQPGGKVTVEGDVIKEYDDTKRLKTAYHGKGKMTVEGKVRAVQFFGRDMKGRFFGYGIFRLYGEFDKNLDTGMFKLDGETALPWGSGGLQVVVPSQEQTKPKAKLRINDGKG